jgi:hypothetical protein
MKLPSASLTTGLEALARTAEIALLNAKNNLSTTTLGD